MSSYTDDVRFRAPHSGDGLEVHRLIANSPPLDLNSVYSYHILCDHFRDTCIVAEHDGALAGFISGYRIPQRPDTLFVWQVVVGRQLRGRGIALRMLESLLTRFEVDDVTHVEATVNPSNDPSRALFERLAHSRGTTLIESTYLEAAAFGSSVQHESEILLRIPLKS